MLLKGSQCLVVERSFVNCVCPDYSKSFSEEGQNFDVLIAVIVCRRESDRAEVSILVPMICLERADLNRRRCGVL